MNEEKKRWQIDLTNEEFKLVKEAVNNMSEGSVGSESSDKRFPEAAKEHKKWELLDDFLGTY